VFKLSSDHLANFRSIAFWLEKLKGWIDGISHQIGNLSTRVSFLEQNVTTTTTTSSSGEQVSKSVSQVAHGFSVGQTIHLNGTTWEEADADVDTKVCDAVVGEVTDADTFVAVISGWVELTTGEWDTVTGGSGGLTAGDYYWLSSTAGGLTTTKPTTGLVQLVLTAVSTTTGIVSIGDVIDSSSGGGGGFGYFPSGW
jgi:hypothetical protein